MKEVFKIVAKKRIIGMLVMSGLFLLMIGTVFAAYTFQRLLSDSAAEIGELHVSDENKKFINYSAGNSDNAKLRVDTVVVIEGITASYTSRYEDTGDLIFMDGKTYYSTDTGTVITDATVGARIDTYETTNGVTVYEQVKTYNKIAAISSAYDGNNESVTCTLNDAGTIITVPLTTSFTITCTVDSSTGGIKTATPSINTYKATISADGEGIVILDTEATASTTAEVTATDGAITCSATSKKSDVDNIYLNQLGLEFTFQVEIPVYVRIHIQDSWKRTRNYASSSTTKYILKDQIEGASPFTVVDDSWYFDKSTNYVYLKNMYIPTQDSEGNYNSATFRFNVNEAYFYTGLTTSVYTEYIDVEVSFTVDIIQANRAEVLWGLDPSTIGNN